METKTRAPGPRIAIAAPLSGSSAALGAEMARAATLAVEEVNLAGGIAGRAVVAEAVDDGGSLERGVTTARTLCTRPEVVGVVGPYNSHVAMATAEIYHAGALPVITPIVSNPAFTRLGFVNIFRFTNSDDETAAAIAGHLRSLGKRRAVVLETSTMYGQSMAGEFERAFRRRGGAILLRRAIAEGERDFGPLVRALPVDFDVMFYGGSFEGAFVLRAMREAGLRQLFAAGDGCWDRTGFLEPAGDAAEAGEGVLVLSATPEAGRVQGSREFADRYARRYGPIGNYAVNSFDSTRLLLTAMAAAASKGGSLNRSAISAEIRAIEFRGIAYPEPVAWDKAGENRAAVTALFVVERSCFRQVAEVPKSLPADPRRAASR